LDSLTELRRGFLSYANRNAITGIPTSRSSLDEQIKKVRAEVAADGQAHRHADHDLDRSLEEIPARPEIRRK
jgi:hypothetical protein